ncbi:ABC transporter substrate-binding protein [Lichenibacterium minor]|uniref:ABC transporter substrate-binding protein n=1 Tax=Lichenibacterium minor TaxID=2316528 RepID=A0A4V1RU96_9HYPH|nr:ABC transporter substrate-binding protein [Lichenibacterium minor]RYC30384.1 ABC transporter substrate-binding protein [Lichenibacterium minor]
MTRLTEISRRAFGTGLVGAATLAAAGRAWAQAPAGGVLQVATIGEPGTLDPTVATSDLVSIITQHVFETLFCFDDAWQVRPLLADGLPTVSPDARRYAVRLRSGVRFHDGTPMTSDDAVASLERWLKLSPRGKQAAPSIAGIAADGPLGLTITLSRPYAPLLALLAMNNGAAAILPKAVASAAAMGDPVGTGPYRFVEHKPDQYIRLARFDGYASPPGTPSGYAGERRAIVGEIRFVPVPNPTTRVDGMLSGQYQFADSLAPEMLPRFEGQAAVAPITVKPFGFPLMIFNERAGPMTDPTVRRAAQAALSCSDMLAAGFGDPAFFDAQGSLYPKGTPYHDEAGVTAYNLNDPAKAGDLLKQAGYKKQPIRIMTSQQYDFLYKMSLVAQQNLQDAGFEVDLQVLDWATLLSRRGDEKSWDAFFTYHTFVPEPSLITVLNPSYPGWWDTPAKHAALDAFNGETDPAKRVADWKTIQALFYAEAPSIKVGDFYNLAARSTRVTGYTTVPWPFFWNVGLAA